MTREATKVMRSPARYRALFAWALFVALAVMIFVFLQSLTVPVAPSGPTVSSGSHQRLSAPPSENLLMSLVPWLLGFSVIAILLIWWARVRLPRRMWETHPTL